MSYQPIIPFSGAAGWAFLQRTQTEQQDAFERSPEITRNTEYFRSEIGNIKTAEALVSDHRLLSVALGAFGLEDDIQSKYLIQKVLEDGTLNSDALANKFTDKRYLELSKAFGFGDYSTPRTQLSEFADEIIEKYETRSFEVAVGEQDADLRLVLSLEREIEGIASSTMSDDGKWYAVMGNAPLRSVFETAFGLPSSFAALDLEQQMGVFREKADRYLGSSEVSDFSNPSVQDELSRLFLVRSQISEGDIGLSSGAIALTLLQNI